MKTSGEWELLLFAHESNNNRTIPRDARVTQGPVNQGLKITKHRPVAKVRQRGRLHPSRIQLW